ncbi:acetyl-CoA carboxylase biotin carboxyl carrier protein [Maricaulaceae bacterium EIL42A08]|nr:acetyl-CoA carboxylase biotin carboxyl carrier protein [Maricaulaceae bacterium EIL42A08]
MASTTSRPQIDAKVVRELADILKDTELTEIEVEKGELRIRVAREITAAPVAYAAPAPAPVAAPAAAPAAAPVADAAPAGETKYTAGAVTSPMVGTAYLRPSPDADAFKKVGDAVKEGETIILVEAMKTFNPITAPKSGTLTEMLVDDAQPVEYGEALFVIS